MSNKGNALISLVILIIGAVFIYFFDGNQVPRSIVFLCGLCFALPALILLMATFFTGKANHSAAYRSIQMICGVGGLGLGACIMLMPDIFRPLLIYPFAVLLIAGGAFQVFLISHKLRPVDYPSWLYIIPIVVMMAGVVMLCIDSLRNPDNERWVVLITGIAAVLYGFNGISVSVLSHRLPRRQADSSPALSARGGGHSQVLPASNTASTADAAEAVAPAAAAEPHSGAEPSEGSNP